MSWILWVLIGLVALVIYINVGHLTFWTMTKIWWGNASWRVVWFVPCPAIFGINGVFWSVNSFNNPTKGSRNFHDWNSFYEHEKNNDTLFGLFFVMAWPIPLAIGWFCAILDWTLLLIKIIGINVRHLLEFLFGGDWLK